MDLAEVVRRHAPAYRERYGEKMPAAHHAALAAIERCHTRACGGSEYSCTECGLPQFAWHRCGHRACGQCGHAQGEAWAARQRERLLPVEYFLVTFTVPEELRAFFRQRQGPAYDLLFKASAGTLQKLARAKRKDRGLGGELGMLGVLHTWTRQLVYHPHIHYLVPGVAMNRKGLPAWPKQPGFLLPVPKLSAHFRMAMKEAIGELDPSALAAIPAKIWRRPWVVHVQAVGRGATAVDYLARYVQKTALSSTRLRWQDDERVCFGYRDRETGKEQTLTLSGEAFLRRFLQHVLPKGFRRVRTYGWLSPAAKKRYEHLCTLLEVPEKPPRVLRPALVVMRCPICQAAMIRVREIKRGPPR